MNDEPVICQWLIGERGEWLSISGDAESLFGATPGELPGRTPAEVLGREAGQTWEARFARALAGEVLTVRESRGPALWLATMFPAEESGGHRRAAGLAVPFPNPDIDRRETVRFLHDQIGQNLTALGLGLDLARMDLGRDPAASSKRILDAQRLLETVMEDVRGYVRKLRV